MSKTRLHLVAAVAAMGILAVPTAVSAAVGPGAPRTPVPGVNSLNSVTCPTAKACVSAGSDDNLNGKSAVINAATGAVKAWPGDLANDPMNAVACTGTTSCLAVADDAVASVAVSSGAMKVTATPKPPANGIVAMSAIACAGSTRCYAVGFEGSPDASTATLLRLSPAGKLLATKKNTGKGIGSIACPSATLCLMGENYSTGLVIQLLNNGSFGTSQPLPANTYIQALSCFKASLCYALGGNSTASPEVTDELFPLNPATGAVGTMATIGGGFHGTSLSCPERQHVPGRRVHRLGVDREGRGGGRRQRQARDPQELPGLGLRLRQRRVRQRQQVLRGRVLVVRGGRDQGEVLALIRRLMILSGGGYKRG